MTTGRPSRRQGDARAVPAQAQAQAVPWELEHRVWDYANEEAEVLAVMTTPEKKHRVSGREFPRTMAAVVA